MLRALELGRAAVAAQADAIAATLYQTVNVRSGPGVRYDIVEQVSAETWPELPGIAASVEW